jgi:2-methylisocitrate lyase-like PEP mutase family enzyme
MLLMVARIASSVNVPVSADIEAGYGTTIAEVVETVQRAIAAGAVGINLEDGTDLPEHPLMDLDYQVELITTLRAAASAAGVPLVINARVDIYLREVGAISGRFERVVERANAYLAAGADCVFPIGLSDGVKIARLVQQVNGPINILAGAGAPLIAELEGLGVRRVSFGSGLMRATLPRVRQMAESLRAAGDYHAFIEHDYTHAVVNRMFAG